MNSAVENDDEFFIIIFPFPRKLELTWNIRPEIRAGIRTEIRTSMRKNTGRPFHDILRPDFVRPEKWDDSQVGVRDAPAPTFGGF